MKTYFRLVALFTLCAIVCAGCGDKKKKSDQPGENPSAAAAASQLKGRINFYSGFGAALDRAGLANQLRAGAVVKLSRISDDGQKLTAVSDEKGSPVNPEGTFSLPNPPSGQVNLVVQILSGEGEVLLSALLPVLPNDNSEILITPETDLEAKVFQEVLRRAAEQGSGFEGIVATNFDTGFIKEFITADLLFNKELQDNLDTATGRLAAIVLEATKKYTGELAGPGKPVMDDIMVQVWNKTRTARALLSSQRESMLTAEAAQPGIIEAASKSHHAAGLAADNAAFYQPGFARRGLLELAGQRRLDFARQCLANKPPDGCPKPQENDPDLEVYKAELFGALSENALAADLVNRALYSSAYPDTPLANFATGTFDLSVKNALVNLELILALESRQILPLTQMLNADLEALADPDADMEPAAAKIRNTMRTIRDYTMTGLLGVDFAQTKNMAFELKKQSEGLARAVADSERPLQDITRERKQFMESVEQTLKPVREHLQSRYDKLTPGEIKKAYIASRTLMLCSSVPDVPVAVLQDLDSDGDSAPDDIETLLETDPNEADSTPTPATTRNPDTLIESPTPDTDSDGVVDDIEIMQETDPDDPASVPDFRDLKFCAKGQTPPCPAPTDREQETREPAGDVTVSGSVTYQEQPISGATVALYKRPVFRTEPVAASMAPTDENGRFTVTAPAGRYFVAAYLDGDANGRADKREAAGYLGNDWPVKIAAGNNMEFESTVSIAGLIGGAACQAGMYLHPESGECAAECPEGTTPDTLSGACRCGDGLLYDITSAACVSDCPEGTRTDSAGGRCICPAYALFDNDERTCSCPMNMVMSDDRSRCMCSTGYMDPVSETCTEECPKTWVPDEDTATCVCPEGTVHDPATGQCGCGTGLFMNTLTLECVSTCPEGTTPDPTGKFCKCPDNETLDEESGTCECLSGMRRDPDSGRCGPPAAKPAETSESTDDTDDGEQSDTDDESMDTDEETDSEQDADTDTDEDSSPGKFKNPDDRKWKKRRDRDSRHNSG